MTRKNIFQLVDENYNINEEIEKINELYEDEAYFTINSVEYSLKEIVDEFLFNTWKFRGTCIDTEEYFIRANASVSGSNSDKEERIINNLELMENFTKLYFDNASELKEKYGIRYYDGFSSMFCFLIKTLEKRMGLTTREYKDRIIIYPRNASLEKVVELCTDEDVQWELIRYVREDLSLSEKRKSLAYLATNLYIEDEKSEPNEHIKEYVKRATNILNNLHIRHNNKTGKWENSVLKDMDKTGANSLCDMLYNEMLIITLLREDRKYEDLYNAFCQKQKEAKRK